MARIIAALLGLLLLVGQSFTVRAQSAATATLSAVNAEGFPTIAALLDVFDAQGQFVTGLESDDVVVIEDGQPLGIDTLGASTPPAQIVVAINPGPPLAVRDGQGVARFQYVVETLNVWAQSLPEEKPDDLSLVSIAGPLISHAEPAGWLVSLTSYQPDFRSTTPNLQSLAIALDTASAPTDTPGMKRAILFITPHMDDPNIDNALADIGERAIELGIRIFVWYVDIDTLFTHPSANAFKMLANQTGGDYFAFSGLEMLPNPETYFSPLRHLYTLSYSSSLVTDGEHTLSVQVQAPSGQIASNEQGFDLEVQPPNPILVAPPGQIVRQPPEDDPYNTEILLPTQKTLEVVVEFPDNHVRPLERTTLYVDGVAVAQNESEPFDIFVWDLSVYEESAQHELSVEVVDSLGLSKTSMAIPVMVTVVHPPAGIQAFLARYRMPITLGVIIFAGTVLIIVLLYGRVRFRSLTERRESRKRVSDPVTQPVAIQQAEPPTKPINAHKGKQAKRLPWSRSEQAKDAPAYLVRLRADGEPSTGNPIPLNEKEMTFGTDPVQSLHIIDDPSVAALHARIKQTESGGYVIFDNGSVGGTWVNYEPVTREGRTLKHGDVVNFGQLMYRFALRKPPASPEPKIIPKAPPQ